jgi:hypothetical protein
MARMKKNRSKRPTIAAPVLGAVGASMALAGGAYATGVVGSTPETSPANDVLGPQINLSEEEIADVNLGTFFVFDRENLQKIGEKYAQQTPQGRRGCSGGRCATARRCGGCGGCSGCRGCSVGGCRSCIACAGCAGCGCGCCLSWGACRFIC